MADKMIGRVYRLMYKPSACICLMKNRINRITIPLNRPAQQGFFGEVSQQLVYAWVKLRLSLLEPHKERATALLL